MLQMIRLLPLLALLLLSFCGTQPQGTATRSTEANPWFDDITQSSGLEFNHFNSYTGEFYFPEIMGSGGALFDYDRDGDLDVFLVQGALLGDHTMAEARFPINDPLRDRIWRNDLDPATGEPRFVEVTDAAGIDSRGYGMGATVGDYDGDGWPDLYITNYGPDQLFRNRGDGTFEDVTAATGLGDPAFGVSAAFFDFDRDGDLDLYVGNYLVFDVKDNQACTGLTRDYCHPKNYPAVPDLLYRNDGGRFNDISKEAGFHEVYGRALGVSIADFNGDAWPDIYVANDATANQLWINGQDGTFEDQALIAGAAYNEMGKAEASMGVDAADIDEDGDEDIFITHNRNETNTLYVNDGKGFFTDRTVRQGLGAPSLPFSAFGTAFFDYDNDGLLDLFTATGAVVSIASELPPGDPYPYHQTNQLYRGVGAGQFEDVSAQVGPALKASHVSRGALFGDLDNDGDQDIIVANNQGPAQVLRNMVGQDNQWLGLDLRIGDPERPALGALIKVTLSDGAVLNRRIRVDGSYASANDPRLIIGLGDRSVRRLDITWPDGQTQTVETPAVNQWRQINQDQEEGS